MKNTFILMIGALLLSACTGKEEKADAYGNFEAREILVSSQVNGNLLTFDVEEGAQLKKGKVVGLIDTTSLFLQKKQLLAREKAIAAQFTQVKAQVEVTAQREENLLKDEKRVERLFKNGAATEKQLDDIRGQLKVLEKQIKATRTRYAAIQAEKESVEKQIEQVEDRLGKCQVINPINGRVLETYIEASELAPMGRNLYKIADLTTMDLRVYVSGAQLSGIQLGQEVKVYIDDNKDELRELKGTLSWISPSAEFTPKVIQTREERVKLVYAVKIKVPNDGSLKIGMPGEAKF